MLNNLKKKFINPFWGMFGFLGILGYFLNPFFYIFFCFFSYFFYNYLMRKEFDKKLEEDFNESRRIIGILYMLLCFFIIFFLSKENISRDKILFFSILTYCILFISMPLLVIFRNKFL